MVVANREHQRDEAAYDECQHLQLAQSFSSTGWVAVPTCASHFWQDVNRGDVEEGASREQHGHSCGVDVRQRLFTALKGEKVEKQNSPN